MKTSALVLIVALAGLDPLAASAAASQTGTSEPVESSRCDVPNVIGLPHDQAVQRLHNGDFSVSVETRPSRTARGTVIDQRPRQCRTSSDGRTVVVVVSAGPSETPTQDGQSAETPRRRSGGSSVGTAAAVGAIAAIGIAAILASRNKDKGADTDKGQEKPPAPAPSAPPVAAAPPEPPRPPARSAVVPEVRGMSAAEAERTIADARLQARTTNPSEAAAAGSRVASQVPSAGTPVVPGASVAVTFEPPPPPPTPVAPTPPPTAVVTPPAPSAAPAAPRIVRTPPPPIPAPTVTPVLPSSPIAGLVEAPRPIVPSVPIVPVVDVEPTAPTVGGVPWAFILILLALASALAWIATHRSIQPPAPRLTLIPNVDPGEQRIAGGGRSSSLDLSFSLDGGMQQIRCLESRVRVGAVS